MNIVLFPRVKEGKEQEFRKWFKASNAVFSRFDGFVSRTLLVSGDGSYAAIVMHRSKETFTKMHNSKEGDEQRAITSAIFDGEPKASFYEVVEL